VNIKSLGWRNFAEVSWNFDSFVGSYQVPSRVERTSLLKKERKKERRMEQKTSFVGGVTIEFKGKSVVQRMALMQGVKTLSALGS